MPKRQHGGKPSLKTDQQSFKIAMGPMAPDDGSLSIQELAACRLVRDCPLQVVCQIGLTEYNLSRLIGKLMANQRGARRAKA